MKKHSEFALIVFIMLAPAAFILDSYLGYEEPEPAKDCEPQLKHFEIKVISEGNYTASPVYYEKCTVK